jgi:hypothetical protein
MAIVFRCFPNEQTGTTKNPKDPVRAAPATQGHAEKSEGKNNVVRHRDRQPPAESFFAPDFFAWMLLNPDTRATKKGPAAGRN